MLQKLPIRVDDDLTVSVKRGTTRLSPGEAMRIAERLIRVGTRQMILDEAADVEREQARE